MANESNILSASIELSLRSLQKGAKAIQQTVDSVNNAADFAQVKNEFASLANRVVQAANMIQTEMGKITKTIDLSQVAKNLDNLDKNVEKIVSNIDTYMKKMGASFDSANKADLSTVEAQLKDLQDSIKKFSALIQSEDFLNAFKSKDVQSACAALRDYATALKSIANIDMSKLTDALSRIGRDESGKAIFDLSPVADQVRDFVDAMDGVANVDRKINTLVRAIERLKEFDGTVDGNVFNQLSKSLDEIASKSIAARDAASGVDITKGLPDEKRLATLTQYIARIYYQFNAISGVKLSKDGSIANADDIVTFRAISDILEDINSNISTLGDKIADAVAKGQDASKVTEQADKALDKTKQRAEQLNDVLSSLKKNALTANQVKNTKDFSQAMHDAAESIKLVVDRLIAMKTNADQALASTKKGTQEVEKVQGKIASAGEGDTTSKIIGDTSKFESAVRAIVVGLSSVQDVSKKAKITIGQDIASIASALKSLTDETHLEKLAGKLNSLTGGDMKGLIDTFNQLTEKINTVGNAITTMFVGKTVSGVNSAKNEVISFISSLEGIKDNMDSFIMADPNDATAGLSNFAQELNKIGTLITRIFTDYESYEAAVNDFNVDLHGQAAFAEHLRKLSTEATTATVNADEFKAALQGVGVSESALNNMMSQTSEAFSQSVREMFSTDPAASFVQNAAQYLNKFRDLSQNSMSKANGFFTAFKDSGDMKTFAVNLQSVAQIISGLNIEKLNELINALHNLFAVKNDTSGSTSMEQYLKSLEDSASRLNEIKNAIGKTGNTSLSDMMNSMNQSVGGMAQSDISGKLDALVNSLKNINTVKLDTAQFENLTVAIKETTKAISDFVKALSKMTPGQLDNLLENIITIANATGNATAQAAAQTKQKYDEMKGNLETAKHAIAGMMKGDETTFKTYSDEFLNAMTAVDEYIKTINNKDGGYHNLKTEADIIRQFQQLWTDATAAADSYKKKQDEIKAKEREKRSGESITRNAQDANTRVAQIKAIASELGKLDSKDGTQFSAMETQLTGLTEAMEKWHRSTTRTKETEAIWAAYQAALVKVNSEMNRLNDMAVSAKKKEEELAASTDAAKKAEDARIQGLVKEGKAFGSLKEAMDVYLLGIREYDIKDTIPGLDNENPIERVVTWYEEGVGKLTAVFKQFVDSAGQVWYYLNDENVNKNKYNENAGVSEIVKTYQRIFDLRVKLAALGKSDTEQKSLLQGQLRDAGATLNALKAIYPEMYKIAKITGDYAKAKEKAEAAETKRTDKTNKSQESADLKHVNELLKRRYEVQKEIQTLELSMSKARSKGTIDATQRRITELKRDESNIDKEIARYDAQGVSNKQLENKYQQQLNEEKERALLKDKQSRDLQDQILSRMMSMVRNIIVMRMMRQIWTEAIKYAQEYYDKMNEIQIVTMKSSSEIAQLSTQYKAMASELKISSTDIATAAVEFWRQGLDATEVAERTKWTSQYAKITGQSFDQAATLVTASTNSMKVSAQEAVDLFTYLGDASASSGEEIGTAMQKSAAAAAAFGLDFKRLGAYIATVSEKTRQEASSIGTAFNTIIARWHSIKKSGYVTNDDGTTTGSNDITKALSDTIGVNLIDAKTGQWRDMGVVFDEIAAKWGNLNAAQKSYIATTMAGTKQQNVFLALMEDMALGAENGSRMYELYAGALDSAGTVAEKYAIYLDSVTAAQEGMNVSLQELYDVIMSGDTLKTFYNTMADLTHVMASGLQTGLAQGIIKFASLAGAIGTVVFIAKKLKDLFLDLQAAKGLSGIMTVLSGGKLMLAVGAIAAVVAGVVALAGAYRDAHDEAKKLQELQTKQQEISADYTALNELKNEYTSLISIANRTEEENARLKQVWEKIQSFSPTLAIALANVSGGMENQTGVTEALNGELERLAENYKNVAIASSTLSVSQIMDQHNASISAIKSSQAMANYRDDLNAFALSDSWSDIAGEMEYGGYEAATILMSEVLKQDEKKLLSIFDQAGWAGSFENIDDFINFANSNPEIVDSVVGDYVSDLIQAINQAWSDAQKESGTEINFSDFIIQSLKNVTDDNAIDKQCRETAQTLYDNFFTVLRPMNWSSMSVGEQSIFTDAFEAMFNYDNFGEDYFNGFNGTPIDYIMGAMVGGEDEVNKMFMRLLIGAQEYATQSSEWKDGWAKAYSDTVDAFKNDNIDNDTAYNALLETYRNMKSQYGDAFFVSMPSRQEFEDIASGVSQIGYSADDASDSAETLSQKLQKVLNQQQNDVQLKALENSNFKEWFDQLNTLFGQTGDDSASLAKGIYSWMSGLNEDQLKKFLEIFPQMTPFFNDIAKMGESNDFSGAADSLTGFGDALAYCSDEMLVAYQIYQEAKSGVTEDEGNGFIQQLANLVGGNIDTSSMGGLFDQFGQKFSSYTAEQQSWLMHNSDAVNQMITAWNKYKAAKERAMNAGTDSAEAERAAKDMADALDEATTAANNLRRESQKITFEKLENGQKVWSGFSDLIENASGKGKDFSDTYGKMIDRVGDLMTAQDALAYIQSGATGDAKMLKSAYSDLASYCGVSAEALATDLSPALWALQSDTLLAETTMANLVSEIFSMTGVTFDPNNMIGSLMAIANSSDETYAALANLAIKMLSLSNATIGVKDGRVVVNIPNSGSASGYKGRYTGSGGGSGGGGSSKKQKDKSKSEEEQWVGEIEKIIKRITDKMSQLKTIMNSWGDQGFLTAEIDALYEMNTLLENQDAILREKIAEAQKRLPALIDEFNRTEPETEAYDKILKRVNEIQDAIVDWTQQLTENEAEIISNNDKIKELRKSIRQLELDLENEVLRAIEDREERINDMLEARISMEEIILDILKTQAEKAEQAILDSIDAQIEALNREKDAISEILNARKEQADAEDKLVKLKELQAKYARIVADPTRAKEANSIMQEINDLRDEIAWDQAENESEAQQSSIDQQITSLEDYRDYIERYYEDLLSNPRNFIDQVNDILKMTQEDILTWLEQNSEEYKNSSDNTRIDLVNGWTDTLNTMNGIIDTHWKEVQDIIAQGEDYVIAFLKENSNQYREASQLQQEAYIEGWQEMFDNIEKAYQKMQANLLDTSNFINKIEWGGSDDSGSGSGSGSGGGGRKKQYMATYPAIGNKPGGTLKGYDSEAAALRAAKDKISAICRELSGSSSSMIGQWAQTFYKQITVKAYKRGGLNMQTGLAWLDGTKSEPERILNATQTKLFDSMVASLQEMSRIRVAPMPYTGDTMTSKSYGYTFGDINISVEKLDTDRDLEDLAERVKESIVDSMVKGHAIGGITL